MVSTTIQLITTSREPFAAALLASASPYIIGVISAERGEAFAPEAWFAWDGDLMAYTEGFEAVRGENEITRDFKRSIIDSMEYQDYLADIDFIRRGGA